MNRDKGRMIRNLMSKLGHISQEKQLKTRWDATASDKLECPAWANKNVSHLEKLDWGCRRGESGLFQIQ